MTEVSTYFPIALSLVFAYAALMKVMRPAAWQEALAGYRLGRAEPLARFAVPVTEVGVAALCVWRPVAGACVSIVVLLAMSAAVMRAARGHQDTRLPCGCFGGTKERTARTLLMRIVVLFGLAVAVVIQAGGLLTQIDPLPATLFALGLVAAGATLVFWRLASKGFVRR